MNALLAIAATLIGELGYEAATLTGIATRAGASIGGLYQYFPNKEAMADALRSRYDHDMDTAWTPLLAGAAQSSVKELVERMLDTLVEFLEKRPAYLPLLEVASGRRNDSAAKNRLRDHLVDLFCQKRPDLTPKKAFRMANVTFQLIKGTPILFTQEDERERRKLLREFKLMLTAYLSERLRP